MKVTKSATPTSQIFTPVTGTPAQSYPTAQWTMTAHNDATAKASALRMTDPATCSQTALAGVSPMSPRPSPTRSTRRRTTSRTAALRRPSIASTRPRSRLPRAFLPRSTRVGLHGMAPALLRRHVHDDLAHHRSGERVHRRTALRRRGRQRHVPRRERGEHGHDRPEQRLHGHDRQPTATHAAIQRRCAGAAGRKDGRRLEPRVRPVVRPGAGADHEDG